MQIDTDYVAMFAGLAGLLVGFGAGLLVGYKKNVAIAADVTKLKAEWTAFKAAMTKKKGA